MKTLTSEIKELKSIKRKRNALAKKAHEKKLITALIQRKKISQNFLANHILSLTLKIGLKHAKTTLITLSHIKITNFL